MFTQENHLRFQILVKTDAVDNDTVVDGIEIITQFSQILVLMFGYMLGK